MIIDSQIWKIDLKKEIEDIKDFFDNADFNNKEVEEAEIEDEYLPEEYLLIGLQAFIKLQKFTIYCAIIIRKLIEANKLSDELERENFEISSFKKYPNHRVNWLNLEEIEKLYGMQNPIKTKIKLKTLTDVIIHSFHFIPKYRWTKFNEKLADDNPENWKNNGLDGFYFSSDRTKDKELFYITFECFIKIIEQVLEDFIVQKSYCDGKLVLKSRKSK